jgi:hypothetical protein
MIAFLLLNDSASDLNTAPESWTIVVDGKDLQDSGFILGNGPMPSKGYGTLDSGANFQFGKALPIAKYFPEPREYKISWRGKYFQSPTATIAVISR